MNICHLCNHELVPAFIDVEHGKLKEDTFYIIENVPCFQCVCKASVDFDAKIMIQIEKVRDKDGWFGEDSKNLVRKIIQPQIPIINFNDFRKE